VLCNMPAKSFTKEEYISQVYAGHYVPVQHQCH
jgi:hypothetical protein